MNRARCVALLAALAILPAIAASPTVEVRFTDPAKFSDLRLVPASSERERTALAEQLGAYLESRALRRLPADSRLAVTITDVDMAGEFRPLGSIGHSELRVVREVYPPRVDLEFRLMRADGTVEREGRRELRDALFLSGTGLGGNDLLRYEKALLERWLAREFAAKR